MFILMRALTYSALFIGVVLIYAPARVLSWSGIARPAAIEVQQIGGIFIGSVGAAVALWCILAFVSLGRGYRPGWAGIASLCDSGGVEFFGGGAR